MYKEIHRRLNQPQAEVLSDLVLAEEQRDHRLDVTAARELLDEADTILKTNILMDFYIQKGIIEYRNDAHSYSHDCATEPREDDYPFAIPSYTTFLRHSCKDESKTRVETVPKYLQLYPSFPHGTGMPKTDSERLIPQSKLITNPVRRWGMPAYYIPPSPATIPMSHCNPRIMPASKLIVLTFKLVQASIAVITIHRDRGRMSSNATGRGIVTENAVIRLYPEPARQSGRPSADRTAAVGRADGCVSTAIPNRPSPTVGSVVPCTTSPIR